MKLSSFVSIVVIALLAAAVAGCGSKSGRRLGPIDPNAVLLSPTMVEELKAEAAESYPEMRGSQRLLLRDSAGLWGARKIVALPQPDGTWHFRLHEDSPALMLPFWSEETVSTYNDEGRRIIRYYDTDVLYWVLYHHASTEIATGDGMSQKYAKGGFIADLFAYEREDTDHELRLFYFFPLNKIMP